MTTRRRSQAVRQSLHEGKLSRLPGDVLQAISSPLRLLLRARRYASDVDGTVWDFSVEIHHLRDAGLTDCDLRWLCSRGVLSHAREVGEPADWERCFRPMGNLRFFNDSCFVLTDAGVSFARRVGRALVTPSPSNTPRMGGKPRGRDNGHSMLPDWDADDRVLRVGDAVIKRFRVPASNQETIITAFHEEHWPRHIDDPLAPVANIDPKRRLHSTIHCLNRNQKCHLIHFHGDGHGTGVCWELVSRDEWRVISMNV